jgi:hypothetical protein
MQGKIFLLLFAGTREAMTATGGDPVRIMKSSIGKWSDSWLTVQGSEEAEQGETIIIRVPEQAATIDYTWTKSDQPLCTGRKKIREPTPATAMAWHSWCYKKYPRHSANATSLHYGQIIDEGF